MKIKIISSQKESFWYSDKIGQEFYATDYNYRNYKVTPNGHLIRIYDCEIVNHYEDGESKCIIPERILKITNRLFKVIDINNLKP